MEEEVEAPEIRPAQQLLQMQARNEELRIENIDAEIRQNEERHQLKMEHIEQGLSELTRTLELDVSENVIKEFLSILELAYDMKRTMQQIHVECTAMEPEPGTVQYHISNLGSEKMRYENAVKAFRCSNITSRIPDPASRQVFNNIIMQLAETVDSDDFARLSSNLPRALVSGDEFRSLRDVTGRLSGTITQVIQQFYTQFDDVVTSITEGVNFEESNVPILNNQV